MAAAGDQAEGDGAAGVIGVGDQIEGLADGEGIDQGKKLSGQGAAVAVAEDKAFVDAGGQGEGEEGARPRSGIRRARE